jgi:UDP-N-acetylmuramoyl-L-alanyl-D-glutamate--2,6-diaminopimelate ligase
MMHLKRRVLQYIRPLYHGLISYTGSILYHFPSDKMVVIGVTGTKGKSSSVAIIHHILQEAGLKVGVSSSVYFSDGRNRWGNDTRNSMPGRFRMHKLMKESVDNGCQVFVMEVTSEGLAQNRHRGIHFDIAVFTNLYPEHIESHGSFEKYKHAKGKLFESLSHSRSKDLVGAVIPRCIIVNVDSEYSSFYGSFPVDNLVSFGISHKADIMADILQVREQGVKVVLHLSGQEYALDIPLLGEFQVANVLSAVAVARHLDVPVSQIISALKTLSPVEGRMNVVWNKPKVIVDYAHIPDALEVVYENVRKVFKTQSNKIYAILGSAGGGRDAWKRAPMGEIASKYADIVIVTNEDPFDEDPQEIINQVFEGVLKEGKKIEGETAFRISDRREAFEKVAVDAKDSDVIVITGKGSERSIVGKDGVKVDWNDTEQIQAVMKNYR